MQYRSSRSNTSQTTSNYKSNNSSNNSYNNQPKSNNIQCQRPILDAINQDIMSPNALIKPQTLP